MKNIQLIVNGGRSGTKRNASSSAYDVLLHKIECGFNLDVVSSWRRVVGWVGRSVGWVVGQSRVSDGGSSWVSQSVSVGVSCE